MVGERWGCVFLSEQFLGFPYHPMSLESAFKRNHGADMAGKTGARERCCSLLGIVVEPSARSGWRAQGRHQKIPKRVGRKESGV